MEIIAEIPGITYKFLLCKELKEYLEVDINSAMSKTASFIFKFDDNNKIAISKWTSPKRTRTYPYARVYDTLGFAGKRTTIIPLIKDEGKNGDRDYLQWDTISLMSLLNVYVIIAYYEDAIK